MAQNYTIPAEICEIANEYDQLGFETELRIAPRRGYIFARITAVDEGLQIKIKRTYVLNRRNGVIVRQDVEIESLTFDFIDE